MRPLSRSLRRLRTAALVVLGLVPVPLLMTACIAHAGRTDYRAQRLEGAALAMVGDCPVAVAGGDARERGERLGRLTGVQAGRLLSLVRVRPALVAARSTRWFRDTLAAIRPEDRVEIAAFAAAAGLDPDDLLAANALVETCCSALVRTADAGQPLLVGRNMDFYPARALGPGTLLTVVRDAGPHAYANIGWAGAAGVVSGMNDAGLVACILLNKDGPGLAGGEPLQLRVRAILAQEADVAGAVARFAASPVGSSHYLLLADERTACVVWREADGVHSDDAAGGWLVASNGVRRGGRPQDARGRRLGRDLPGPGVPVDAAWMRGRLTASYMTGLNAQAMVFSPAGRELQLARGTGTAPAALQSYRRIPLAPLFAGGDPAALPIAALPAAQALPDHCGW